MPTCESILNLNERIAGKPLWIVMNKLDVRDELISPPTFPIDYYTLLDNLGSSVQMSGLFPNLGLEF